MHPKLLTNRTEHIRVRLVQVQKISNCLKNAQSFKQIEFEHNIKIVQKILNRLTNESSLNTILKSFNNQTEHKLVRELFE